mgnify:CR=1 FL=1
MCSRCLEAGLFAFVPELRILDSETYAKCWDGTGSASNRIKPESSPHLRPARW